MTTTIATRAGRIISGSAHALINAVENAAPEMVMEQALREVDDLIDEVRTELGRQAASKHLANSRIQEENRKHEALAEQIAVAVQEQRDDLAATAIAQQLDIEAQLPLLERTIADCTQQEQELDATIKALQGRRREMQDELARFAEQRRNPVNTAANGTAKNSTLETKLARAESAFDRVLERNLGLPGRRGAVDAASAARLAELETLNRDNRVQERLAALKSVGKEQ